MDLAGVAAVIIAIGGVLGGLYKLLRLRAELKRYAARQDKLDAEQAKLRDEQDNVWNGIVARGFVEALQCDHLVMTEQGWAATSKAREIYSKVSPLLRATFKGMRWELGVIPSAEEFGLQLLRDSEMRQWMLDHACPALSLNKFGCIAIAYVLAAEDATGVCRILPKQPES